MPLLTCNLHASTFKAYDTSESFRSKENFQMWHTHLCKFLLAKVNFHK